MRNEPLSVPSIGKTGAADFQSLEKNAPSRIPNTPLAMAAFGLTMISGIFAAAAWMTWFATRNFPESLSWGILISALAAVAMAVPVRRSTCGQWAFWFGFVQAIAWVFFWFLFSFVIPQPGAISENLSFGPEIERVVVSRDQAIIMARGSDDAGMYIMIGTHTNAWSRSGLPFTVTVSYGGRFWRGAKWVVKPSAVNLFWNLESENGTLTGWIMFREGTPAPEADGSYVVGEFKSKNGRSLPISVRLVRDGKPTASPSAVTWSPALAVGEIADLQKIRSEADSLMNQGRYEESLQRRIWYFNHALEHGESNPVRLSFGLSGWVELARRYPKAKQALIEVRDRDAQLFAKGDGSFDSFQEAANINRELRDDDATVALFKSIQKDPTLASQCYFVAEELLVRKGEYALCLSCMGDPQVRFQRIRELWDMDKNVKERDNHAVNRLIRETRQLIEILISAGRKPEAEQIRDEVVKLLDDARLKSAVGDAEEKIRRMLPKGK